MKAPISWLAEYAALPVDATPRAVADALIRVGLEVERVASGAEGLTGPVVVGRVLEFVAEPQKNGKTIRWCQVDVGPRLGAGDDGSRARGIVCGAANFAVGDLVVVSLPGAVLPGGFAISARKTYGHVSDGMICSVRELGIGDEHDGILVLPESIAGSVAPGDDAREVLGLGDAVLDVATTTDRGYTLSVRGLAREAAAAFDVPFTDVTATVPEADGGAHGVRIDDPTGCDRFSVRAVTGVDPAAPTPELIVRRLRQCGVRSISLAVDVTNYVMLETGQPLHAFDRSKVRGALVARRARAGEQLITLDGTRRTLDRDDMVVADDSGVVALAGVMGGESTEIGPDTTDVLLEAAHWDPAAVSRTVRRHRLPSEAARRFERDVDPDIAGTALARCVDLLVEHGGATAAPGYTVVGTPAVRHPIPMPVDLPAAVAGMPIDPAEVDRHLRSVGCTVEPASTDAAEPPDPTVGTVLLVRPPSWRPDLTVPADLVEEVVRLAGYDRLPSVLPPAPPGGGLTGRQQFFRSMSRAVAASGLVEVLSYPFVAPDRHRLLGGTDRPLRLANPLSADEPELRTTLLPGLVATALRNLGRGNRDLALFEMGQVFLRREAADRAAAAAELPGVDARPTDEQLAALDALLPDQPRRLGAVLCGNRSDAGWWGPAEPVTWADAVEVARCVARTARFEFDVRAADQVPWHPGRCAALVLDGVPIGYAGELHPRVVAALGLPDRTCAVELDLDALPVPSPAVAPVVSEYPPALLDVALVVPVGVPAGDVEATLRASSGPLLESVRLFDVYRDPDRLGAGLVSLAFALRFRAPDRTLTVDEAAAARDVAVAAAATAHGAVLRA